MYRKIKIFIIEDLSGPLRQIKNIVSNLSLDEIGFARSGESALEKILALSILPNILMIDIKLDEHNPQAMNGFDIINHLYDKGIIIPYIVYSSYNKDYDAYPKRYQPLDYIAKGTNDEDLETEITKNLDKYLRDYAYFTQMTKRGGERKIYYKDVICVLHNNYARSEIWEDNKYPIEKSSNAIAIYVWEDGLVKLYEKGAYSLTKFMDTILYYPNLVRIHESYIINKNFVKSFGKKEVTLNYIKNKNGEENQFRCGQKEEYVSAFKWLIS